MNKPQANLNDLTVEQTAKLLIVSALRRKLTAIVIGPTFRWLDHPLTDLLVREVHEQGARHLESVRKYEAITLTNGTRIFFATPNGLHYKLNGLILDFVWIATPLTSLDHHMIWSRTITQSAIVIESLS